MTINKTPFVLTAFLLAVLSFILGVAVWPANGWCIAGVVFFGLLAWLFSKANIEFSVYSFREEVEPEPNFVAHLYAMAFQEMRDCHHTASLVEPLFPGYPLMPPAPFLERKQISLKSMNSYPFGPEWPRPYGNSQISSLARSVSGNKELPTEDILSVFFTDEAVTVLHKLPNRYWFWQVIKGAAAIHQNGDFSEKIDVETLREVVTVFRERLCEQREIDLDTSNFVLNNEVCAYWQALGIVLFDEERMTRVRNPIFESNEDFTLFD